MDSKSVDHSDILNLEVVSNIWTRRDGQEPTVWEALEFVPGDLRVQFVGATEDIRMLRQMLNERQMREYKAFRFWLPFGSEIKHYRPLT